MQTSPFHQTRLPPVYVVEDDYERLSDVLCEQPIETEALALLWTELLRATILGEDDATGDIVRMKSTAHYTDVLTGKTGTARLVYPDADRSGPVDVAVTSTLGAALIGLRSGAVFSWTSSRDGACTIRIDRVEPAPRSEAAHAAERRPRARRQGPADAAAPGFRRPRPTVRIWPITRSSDPSGRPASLWTLTVEAAATSGANAAPHTATDLTFPSAIAAIRFVNGRGWRYYLTGQDRAPDQI